MIGDFRNRVRDTEGFGADPRFDQDENLGKHLGKKTVNLNKEQHKQEWSSFWFTLFLVLAFVFGVWTSWLSSKHALDFKSEAMHQKKECEKSLPRNQYCEMKWIKSNN